MKNKVQPKNTLVNGADAVVRGLLTGGVVKAGVSLATNVATGAVAGQISSRGELQAIRKGANEIYYDNCADVELIAPGDTELACIKLYVKATKAEMIFLFSNYSSEVNKATKLCSTIKAKIQEAAMRPMVTAAVQQTMPIVNQVSAADEILKFKNLYDVGAITQEEFEAKKKQLLGL